MALLVALGGCGGSQPRGIPLERSAHPLARPEVDRGPAPLELPLSHLSIVFKPSPEQIRDRDRLLAAQLDPSSESFRHWLTPAEYAARFGARPADIERTTAWLQAHGFQVHGVSPLGARVAFSGTAGQLQSAFHAEVRRYEINGQLHHALKGPPELPAELSGAILALYNAHDFVPHPAYVSGGQTGFAVPDWANVYDSARLSTIGIGGKQIDGTGASVAVVGLAAFAQTDIYAWRTRFNLGPTHLVNTLIPNTGSPVAGTNGTGAEAILAVEWAGGVAPGATIHYVFNGGNDSNADDAAYYAIEQNLADVLVETYGQCEFAMSQADQDVLQLFGSAANLLGMTYVAPAGDQGAAGCLGIGQAGLYVETPASFPGVTGVGGTSFPLASLAGSPYFTSYSNQEAVWNDSNAGLLANPNVAAGGGGISVVFNRPTYQPSVGTCPMVGALPVAGVNPSNMRQVPDVSFTAGAAHYPGFLECTLAASDCSASGGNPILFAAGGTSFGAPAFAGVVALMRQAAAGRLGNINPLLYAIQAAVPASFHDITTGANEVTCAATYPGCPAGGLYGYPAAAGYDCATGLGSPDVYNLVSAVASMASTGTVLTPGNTFTTEGAPTQLTATVQVPFPNAQVLGGTVGFSFVSYDLNGTPDLSWRIGSATVTGTTASGTATVSVVIPPGLVRPGMQAVDVVAEYEGDSFHLPSTSAKVSIQFGPVSFGISPATATVVSGAGVPFSTTGGVAPVRWLIRKDTTCSGPLQCSTISASGAFTAGAMPGQVLVAALDADNAEVEAAVTVTAPPDAGSSDAGAADAGAADAGAADAGTADAGAPDAGASDAGMGDAGVADAGGLDAGPLDAGAPGADAGPTVVPDAGHGTGSGGGGCGCGSAGAGVLPALLLLALLGWFRLSPARARARAVCASVRRRR